MNIELVVYLSTTSLLTLFNVFRLSSSRERAFTKAYCSRELIFVCIIALGLIMLFGFRDHTDVAFGDTVRYATRYFSIEAQETESPRYDVAVQRTELLWNAILRFFALNHLGVVAWFILLAAIWIGSNVLACAKFFPGNILLGFNFALLNFGFYSNSVNGIRNVDALGLVIIALAFIAADPSKFKNILAAIACGVAGILIHHSVVLPFLCLFVAAYIIKNPLHALIIWVAAIILSLISGYLLSHIIADSGLNAPNRLYVYMVNGTNIEMMSRFFSHVGFRWDFLLFSAVPIAWGAWVIFKKKAGDLAYNIIFITYVLANAAWVILIRAAYSNRFAMLSWFLQWLVICYPLIRLNLFHRHQSHAISMVLVAMLAITIIL